MTHRVHPYAHRLGIIRDWKSRWFGVGEKYRTSLKADILIREYLEKRLKNNYVSGIEIERNEKALRVVVASSRPGMIIGRSGEGAEKLKADLKALLLSHKLGGADVLKLDIEEVRSPESNASIVAQMVSEGLLKKMPFRRVLKQTVEKVMSNRDVKGVKIQLAGRLGNADMARREQLKKGRIPLQTFRSDIDYASLKVVDAYGAMGVKVWIYKGEIFNQKKEKVS